MNCAAATGKLPRRRAYSAERRAQPVVDQMLDYLVQHYDQLQAASLADLAAHLKMNADYLWTCFPGRPA